MTTWPDRFRHDGELLFPRAPRVVALSLLALLAACAQHTASSAKTTTTQGPEATPAPSTHEATKKELPARQDLPLVLRETLSSSMERHGEELTFLLADVVLLQYAQAEELAQLLADEPKLGRPAPGDVDSLNALLPEAFFVYQDQLAERAKVLGQAAHAKNDAALVKAFGALAETCVGCHSTYLHDPLRSAANHDEGID